MRGSSKKSRGSALLAVLWMTVMLSFVALALSSTVRSETESTRLRAQSEQGYFLARAGIDAALLRMMSPPADPKQAEAEQYFREYNFKFTTGDVRVEYRPATALYNVNTASVPMLTALFGELGLPAGEADLLARQVEAYRRPAPPEPNRLIESLEELLVLPAMTRDIYYGGFRAGRRRPPLYELLGCFGSNETVNVNYARFELLAVLPEMDERIADDIVANRPVNAIDGRRPGARNLMLGSYAQAFTLIAHGRANTSGMEGDVERVIRAVFVRDEQRPLHVRITEWHE